MKIYTYKALGNIKSQEPQIISEQGKRVGTVERVYDSGLKKLLDGYFDNRYFLKYIVHDVNQTPLFQVKKVFRRGKLWYAGIDLITGEKYIISYENWRIGIPELFINGKSQKVKIEKEMETWSDFILNDKVIARWLAVYDEQLDEFVITLEVEEDSPVQNMAFFIAIAQATLFIGV